MSRAFSIAGRPIGPGHPVYVVAEMSANHGASLEHAERVLRAAKAAGADAVKIQTYTPETMTLDLDRPPFTVELDGPWHRRTLWDLYAEAHTPWSWHPRLFEVARDVGIPLFSTPFDASAVDLLASLGAPATKIASFELVDHALIAAAARTGRPLIISTGMATLGEIAEAVAAARAVDPALPLALLKCTSAYPAPASEANLATIPVLADAFDCVAGLSDHTMGSAVPIAAVALGASLIEKHFCLSRAEGGPDSAFSMEPDELARMVRDLRAAEAAIGRPSFTPSAAEEKSRAYRRSLFAVARVRAGEPFTAQNVRAIRPGGGLAPKHLPSVVGRRATRDVERGTPLSWGLVGAEVVPT